MASDLRGRKRIFHCFFCGSAKRCIRQSSLYPAFCRHFFIPVTSTVAASTIIQTFAFVFSFLPSDAVNKGRCCFRFQRPILRPSSPDRKIEYIDLGLDPGRTSFYQEKKKRKLSLRILSQQLCFREGEDEKKRCFEKAFFSFASISSSFLRLFSSSTWRQKQEEKGRP